MTVNSVVDEFLSGNRISEVKHVESEFQFVPKGFGKSVSVRIYRYSGSVDQSYYFETSHYAHTPIQASPYITSSPWVASIDSAAKRAVEGILSWLEDAQSQGHELSDSWLVENSFWT